MAGGSTVVSSAAEATFSQERLIAAANRMWQDNRVEISRSLDLPAPADQPDIVDYLQRARHERARSGR